MNSYLRGKHRLVCHHLEKKSHIVLNRNSHNGNIYFPKSGFSANLHLSLRERGYPAFRARCEGALFLPTSSSSVVGMGVYSPAGGERNWEASERKRKKRVGAKAEGRSRVAGRMRGVGN